MPVAARITEEIELPEAVKADLEAGKLTVKGPKGELSREFIHPKIKIEKREKALWVDCALPNKSEKALLGTYIAHIKNMLKGVTQGFQYELKIVYSHFPIKTTVKANEVIIENFLGEHSPRRARIVGDTKVELDRDRIILTGIDLEKVSQTAANLELATKIKGRDPRIFQDGIYITQKG